MRRDFLLGGGALIVVAVIIAGIVMMGGPLTPTPSTPGSPQPGDLTTPAPTLNTTATPTPAPPVFVPDDPGEQSYPENATSVEEELLYTRDISNHLYSQITTRRAESDLLALPKTTILGSVTRAHSWDMYNRSYVQAVGPDSPEPVESYSGTATECSAVQRVVLTYNETFRPTDGESRYTSSEGVAAEFFAMMLDDEQMKQLILTEQADAIGVGTYMASQTVADGTETVDIYLTVDYCTTQ